MAYRKGEKLKSIRILNFD